MTDLANDLRTRYECTAGFTRDIYMPEQRDLDLQAADEIERLTWWLQTICDECTGHAASMALRALKGDRVARLQK